MINWLEQHLFTCYFKSQFGLECPGCGLQRSFIALLKGDLVQSWHYHPALIPFMVTLMLLIVQIFLKHKNGGKLVMWSFILTCFVTTIQYVTKQLLLL